MARGPSGLDFSAVNIVPQVGRSAIALCVTSCVALLGCQAETAPAATAGTTPDSLTATGDDTGAGSGSTAAHARYDAAELASGDFYAMPWPSDARADEDGHPDLSGFPNPVAMPLIDTYLASVAQDVGFGLNTAMWVAFDQPIDTTLLPTPSQSTAADAALLLVDVDPNSADYGQAHPLQWVYRDQATDWYPADLLAVSPVFGLPLHRSTTYALILSTVLAQPTSAFMADLASAPDLDPLRLWLADSGQDPADVAVASVFTTADPLVGLVRANDWVRSAEVPDLSQDLVLLRDWSRFKVYTGSYRSPVFQEGKRPYAGEGGGLVFDKLRADQADPVSWDEMRLALGTPTDLSEPPPDGWPVAIILHGTGGDYLSGCCEADRDLEHAAVLGDAGILVLGIDLPLHGARGGDDALTGLVNPFNFLNPDSARSVLRQGAIDAIYLAHSLATQPPTFTLPGGQTLSIDPSHVFVLGQSQGGLGAALAIPFFGTDVDAAVIAGAGGGMAITLLDRTDPFSLQDALAAILQLGPDDTLDELHPVAVLVQWLSEVTDPLDYGPWYFDQGGLWDGQAPVDVLLYSGMDDVVSSYRIAEALAAAARSPVLAPAETDPISWTLAGIGPEEGPLRANAPSFDGGAVTAALTQWPDEGHGVIYDNATARGVYQAFLRGAATGAPVILR